MCTTKIKVNHPRRKIIRSVSEAQPDAYNYDAAHHHYELRQDAADLVNKSTETAVTEVLHC